MLIKHIKSIYDILVHTATQHVYELIGTTTQKSPYAAEDAVLFFSLYCFYSVFSV